MYVELINLIKKMEPELVTKKRIFKDFSLKPFSEILSLYPKFTPDVFLRLWQTRLNSKEILKRRDIAREVREDWKGKLEAQNHLSDP